MKSVPFQSDAAAVWQRYPAFSGKLAFDVGANGGRVARVLSHRFERVIAFEPADESYAALVTHKSVRIEAVPLAISDHCGVVVLEETARSTGAFGELVTRCAESPLAGIWGTKTGERSVECATLDWCAKRWGDPDFIKIDVEGHEVEVIAGGTELFQRSSPVLMIEMHAARHEQPIVDALPGYRWTRYLHELYPAVSPRRAEHYWLEGHRDAADPPQPAEAAEAAAGTAPARMESRLRASAPDGSSEEPKSAFLK